MINFELYATTMVYYTHYTLNYNINGRYMLHVYTYRLTFSILKHSHIKLYNVHLNLELQQTYKIITINCELL